MSKYPGRIISNLAPAGYSVAFNGSSYLSVANNAALDLGSGDFTIEGWWYFNDTSNQSMVSKYSGGAGYVVQQHGSTLRIVLGIGGSDAVSTFAWTPVAGVWYHVAITRSGTNGRAFVNGTQVGTIVTLSTSNTAASVALTLGFTQTTSEFTRGNLSNFRFTKGTALYTSNFNVPTQLFPVTNTQLLTCQSPSFVDNSTNTFPVTVGGGTPIASTFTPFPAYVPYNPALGASTPGVWTVDEAMQAAATRQWNMYDPYFNLTTLLLHGNGANTAQNNTFLDSSTNNFSITRNGNTTQGSFSPFSQTGWSNFFDGSGDNLTSTQPALNATFTIEAWIYRTSGAALQSIVHLNNGGVSGVVVYLDTSNYLVCTDGVNAQAAFSNLTVPINAWTHIAVVRSGGTTTGYVNGTVAGSNSFTPATVSAANIGAYNGSLYFPGYISNVRVVNGSAVYTGAFTPPTSPLTAITNTSLLTCQNNRFIDNSSNAYTITRTGDVSVQPFSPFLPTRAYTPQTIGGSGYFDGTTDYLQTPSSATLQLGSSDFSIEWWEYRDTIGADDTPVTTGDYTVAFNVALLGYGGTSGFVSTNGSSWNVFSGAALARPFAARSWNHYLYTRSGTAFRVFINGLLSNYATASGSITQNNNRINVGGNAGGATYDFPGYISNVRVVKGSIPTAYQTSSTTTNTQIFTPPTSPVTTTSQGATANDVILLLNFTNAGVVDSTADNVLETVGNAQISTTQSVFGGTSMSFNGTNSTLLLRNSQLMNLGASDFTLEFWMYRSAATASQPFYSLNGSSQTNVLALDMNASGGLLAYATASGGGTWSLLPGSSFGTVPLTTWTHVALVRNGSTWRGYLNGVVGFTVTNSSALASFDGVSIGSSGASTLWFNGFIDDIRITRGFARYTGNFTPQTSQWQDQ